MRRLAGFALLAAAGCSDDVVCPNVGSFALTAPDGFAELVPGGTVTVAWTTDGSSGAAVRLEAIAMDLPDRIALPPANLGDGELVWDGSRGDGTAAPPANYRVGGEVGSVGGCEGTPIVADDLHLIVVQGIRMPAQSITFAGSQLTRMFTVETVTRSLLNVRYALDPDPFATGDELVFVEDEVPGEFTPIARPIQFSGMTVGGAAIPDGTYDLVALVGTPEAYRVIGPRLTWHPAQ